jgi:hypothetical protein
MPVHSYRCKYCHQQKNTQTALNRHIAHSPRCFQSWQHEILNLSSTNAGVDCRTNLNSRSAPIGDDSDVESSSPDRTVPNEFPNEFHPSFVQLTDEVDEDVGVGADQPQTRYRVSYPGGYTPEILGEGKTRFQRWQEEKRLNGENDWAPFENQKEWDLARWLMKNVGQKSIDEYLKLPIVSLATYLKLNYLAGFRFTSMPNFHFITPIHS